MFNQKADVAAVQAQLNQANAEIATLKSQLAAPTPAPVVPMTLFTKPMPALFQVPSDPQQVMLGEFFNTNLLMNRQACIYPQHSANCFPSPVYEPVLNDCDCNRLRTDLADSEVCIKIANSCQKAATYCTDQAQWGMADDWHPPFFVRFLGKDDCETLSGNIRDAILYYEMKFGVLLNHSVFLGLGHLIEGAEQYGHGFIVIAHNTSTDPNDSFIIEGTLNFEAEPMTFTEATSGYWIDWGLIGYARTTYPEGCYQMQPQYSWWNGSQLSVGSYKHEGFISKVKRFLSGELSEEEKKKRRLKEIWEPRRRLK
jgi:hypothetical protein